MFDLDPGDALALLVETTRQLAKEALTPRLREAEAARAVEPGVRRAWAQIGLDRLELPESLEGAGLGSLARVLANEELGAADPGAALALDALGAALPALEALGEAVLARTARALLEGGGRAVVAWAPDCALEARGGALYGSVPYVPCDAPARLLLLAPDGIQLLEEGLRAEPLRGAGLRAAGACALQLEGAPVAAACQAGPAVSRALARVRLYFASLLLGVMRHACDFSRAYALERKAFGRPIAHHQALAFLITDMQMALDGARLLVHQAAFRLDAAQAAFGLDAAGAGAAVEDAAAEAAAAFAQCIETSRSIGPNGVQILGGHGFMADYPVEKAMREARALGLLAGGYDAAVECAGRRLCEAGGALDLPEAG